MPTPDGVVRSVFLDESVPRQLAEPLRRLGLLVGSMHSKGWAGIQNGELLRRIEGEYDALLTSDKNMRFQQSLRGRRLAVIVLPSNRRSVIADRVADIAATIELALSGYYIVVDASGRRSVHGSDIERRDCRVAGNLPVQSGMIRTLNNYTPARHGRRYRGLRAPPPASRAGR